MKSLLQVLKLSLCLTASIIFAQSTIAQTSNTTSTASIEITWECPTTKENGTQLPLSELSKTLIYFKSGTNNWQSVEFDTLDDQGQCKDSYTLVNLAAGTYTGGLAFVSTSGLVGDALNLNFEHDGRALENIPPPFLPSATRPTIEYADPIAEEPAECVETWSVQCQRVIPASGQEPLTSTSQP